jgi:hypothetical protein
VPKPRGPTAAVDADRTRLDVDLDELTVANYLHRDRRSRPGLVGQRREFVHLEDPLPVVGNDLVAELQARDLAR